MCASMSAIAGDNSPTMGLEPGPERTAGGEGGLAAIVAARNEADRVGETVRALHEALPAARVWVADDASSDGTAEAAMLAGAEVVRRGRSHGKGGNVTAAAEAALSVEPSPRIVLLCDGDLGTSAARLAPLGAAGGGGGWGPARSALRPPPRGGVGPPPPVPPRADPRPR